MINKFDFKSIFYLDLRALAISRILFGFLLLYDLLLRSRDLVFHYTDSGVLPVQFLVEQEWKTGFFSLHTFSGGWEWQAFLFIFQGIFALTFLIGYKTKLSLFFCWILLISLHNRNPLVLDGGDTYFRILLFWCLFLPMGAKYSIDAMKSYLNNIPDKFYNIGSVGFIVQVMLIYLVGVVLKNSPEWLHDGTALYYALSLDQMVKPFGSWLLNFPDLLKLMTFGTLLVEFVAPILLIFPYKNSICRIIGIGLLLSLHFGIELTLHVGIFSFACMAALLALTPTELIDRAEKKLYALLGECKRVPHKTIPYTGVLKSGIVSITGALFLSYILIWNINTVPKTPELLPEKTKIPAYLLRLDQRWSMFAPRVMKTDGWFIIEALLVNGKKVELFHQTEITDTDYANNKPDYLFQHYKNTRWRKYFSNLIGKRSDLYYETTTQALIYSWNKNNSESIVEIQVYFMHEPSLPLGFDPILNKNIVHKKSPGKSGL